MSEMDIEIIERDNNIPPEESILAKKADKTIFEILEDVYREMWERRPVSWGGHMSPLFKINKDKDAKRVYGETIEYKATN